MSIRRVVPNIRARQTDENRTFYADFLGFDLRMDMGWIMTFVSPSNPTAQVSLIRDDSSRIPPEYHPDFSVEVDDVDTMYAEAVVRGLEIVYPLVDEPWGVRRFFVRDPNGAIVNILSQPQSSAE